MFKDIYTFFDEIGKVDYDVHYYTKIAFIVIILTIISFIVYAYQDFLDKSVFRESYTWFYFIALVNFINIIAIYYFYNQRIELKGLPGVSGKKGSKGERGKFGSCSYCKTTLFIQKVKKYNTQSRMIKTSKMTLNTDRTGKMSYRKLFDYFDNNNIDYSTIVKNGMLQKGINYDFVNRDYQNYFKLISTMLYDDDIIIDMFAYFINKNIGKTKESDMGTIIRPVAKYGYSILGDSIKGGLEDFKLNAFIVSGGGGSNILYPKELKSIIRFKVYDLDTKTDKYYQIWRGISRDEPYFADKKGKSILKHYHSLGDLVSAGSIPPTNDLLAHIDESCLEKIPDDELELLFVFSDSNYKDLTGRIDASNKKERTHKEFKIDKPASTINMFGIWRTPMNTILTSYVNNTTTFYNNTMGYNLIEGQSSKLDNYGNLNYKTKLNIVSRLKKVKVNVLQAIIIMIHYYSVQLKNKFIFYLNKYADRLDTTGQNDVKNLLQKRNLVLNDIHLFLNNPDTEPDSGIINRYAQDNMDRLKKIYDVSQKGGGGSGKRRSGGGDKGSGKGRSGGSGKDSGKGRSGGGGEYAIGEEYIPTEKKIPKAILRMYEKSQETINDIDRKAYSIDNLYKLVLEVFPNGLDERIAIDNEGLAEGGEILTYAQEWVFYFCKVVLPPVKQAYRIKNECIGTIKIDDERRILEMNLERQVRKYKNLMMSYKVNYDKFCNNWGAIIKYQDLSFKIIGDHVGHIPNFMDKIDSYDFEPFTKSRLKIILEEYYKMNRFIEKDCKNISKNVSDIE